MIKTIMISSIDFGIKNEYRNSMRYIVISLILISGCGREGLFLGNAGSSGKNGINGHSGAFSQVLADTSVCVNGGYVFSSGVDTNDDTILQADETKTVTIVCNGTNGVNATPVTIVNLCPGVNSYPRVFIEIGLCINSELYGIYSANGGFMTKLSDGNYSSNAIGSSCDLTINGCTVIH